MSQINETTPSHAIPFIPTLLVHFHLCLFLESDLFPSHFPTVIFIQLLFPMRDISVVLHLTLTLSDNYKLKKIELIRLSVLVIRE
jgi:hypothetical protein